MPNFPRSRHFSDSSGGNSRLTGSAKMADCVRVPLLMLLVCILSFVCPIQGENNIVSKLADNPQKPAGGPGPAAANPGAAEKNLGVAASLPRKRSTGWKLADEAACRDDLTRLCPKHSWNNNLSVLECLQDKNEVKWRTLHCGRRGKSRVCLCRTNQLTLAPLVSQPLALALRERHANCRSKILQFLTSVVIFGVPSVLLQSRAHI